MIKALIGSNGFIGSSLIKKQNFNYVFNSSNIGDIIKNEYDLVVCAAPSAVKWKINKEPIFDFKNICNIMENLYKTKSSKFILISSIDVYGEKIGLGFDENNQPEFDQNFYGLNRAMFEKYFLSLEGSKIIRLPGLFGNGIKKNIIFDLLNNNMVENICLESKFQWFNVDKIDVSILSTIQREERIFNICPEPILTREIVQEFFPIYLDKCKGKIKISYDVRTCFAKNYWQEKNEVMKEIGKFVSNYEKN